MSEIDLLSLTSIQNEPTLGSEYQFGQIPAQISGEPHLRIALKAIKESAHQMYPAALHDASYVIGCRMYRDDDFGDARRAFVLAHQAIETLRRQIDKESLRYQLATQSTNLYARLVHCCIKVDPNHRDAFKYAVFGKGRIFVDRLAKEGFNLAKISADNPNFEEDWPNFSGVLDKIDEVRQKLARSDLKNATKNRLDQELKDLYKEQGRLWQELTVKYRALTATQAAPALEATQAMKLANDVGATLVAFFEHVDGWSAFVVTSKTVNRIDLPLLNEQLLSQAQDWVHLIERQKKEELKRDESKQKANEVLGHLYKAAIAPLRKSLPDSGRLILAPFGKLHLLPLHAAFNEEEEEEKCYLFQKYSLSFTPSLSALRVLFEKDRKIAKTTESSSSSYNTHPPFKDQINLLNVAYPGKLDSLYDPYLDNVIYMAEQIARTRKFLVKRLYEDEATIKNLLQYAQDQTIINIFSHNEFDPEQPEHSGLLLNGGHLTVQRIITQFNLEQTRLITLGACSAGQAQINQGEELVGLIQALMIAKAKAVVAGLWEVVQDPTLTLFKQFYDQLTAGQSPAEALRQAAQHVRKQPEWEHPYYWAAFQVSGLAYEGFNKITHHI